jgi:hypothetical protein
MGFSGEYIQASPCDPTGLQGFNESRFIYNTATRHIDQITFRP